MTNETSEQRTSGYDFLDRAAVWTIGGAIANLRGSKLAACAVLGPLSEQLLNYRIEDVFAEAKRKQEEEERQERIRQTLQAWVDSKKPLPANATEQTQTIVPSPSNTIQPVPIDPETKWLSVIPHLSVALVLGKRGSGSSGKVEVPAE